jgi:hypothetical protein
VGNTTTISSPTNNSSLQRVTVGQESGAYYAAHGVQIVRATPNMVLLDWVHKSSRPGCSECNLDYNELVLVPREGRLFNRKDLPRQYVTLCAKPRSSVPGGRPIML